MKKKHLFLTAMAVALMASCADSSYLGDPEAQIDETTGSEAIQFGFNLQNATRADIMGPEAAKLLILLGMVCQ